MGSGVRKKGLRLKEARKEGKEKQERWEAVCCDVSTLATASQGAAETLQAASEGLPLDRNTGIVPLASRGNLASE